MLQNKTEFRYPRYTSFKKLMETKFGRCGEMAAIFSFVAAIMGLESRFIVDLDDHVWSEVKITWV
jgi:peptide-N4-(N-acetyl-beta-glucosaminyl)asparagine amidase